MAIWAQESFEVAGVLTACGLLAVKEEGEMPLACTVESGPQADVLPDWGAHELETEAEGVVSGCVDKSGVGADNNSSAFATSAASATETTAAAALVSSSFWLET